MKHDESWEIDHYALYLLNHLREHRFPQATDSKFISDRADAAYTAFNLHRLEGKPVDIAHELAMRELLKRVYVSRWDVIMHIIEEDLWLRIPPENQVEWADLFVGLRFINRILDENEVNGDFLERGSFLSLHAKLLAEMTEILDGYGL